MFRIDHTERDMQRRFEILKGANYDLEKARQLYYWMNTGFVMGETPPRLVVVSSDKNNNLATANFSKGSI
jgi:hypothetical protein